MKEKTQLALTRTLEKFQNQKLSDVVSIAMIQIPPSWPSSKWSLSNRVLAYMQANTVDCRGYNQWLEAGRQVQKGAGAHTAYIWAPNFIKKTDKATGDEAYICIGFHPIPVFPRSCTEGEPVEDEFTPRQLPPLAQVAQALGITITYTATPGDRRGDTDTKGQKITLCTHHPKTFYHELAHAIHARLNGGSLQGGQDTTQETVAEFTACVLMELYEQTDLSGNAWGYIQQYAKDPLQAIGKAMSTIEKVLDFIDQIQQPEPIAPDAFLEARYEGQEIEYEGA